LWLFRGFRRVGERVDGFELLDAGLGVGGCGFQLFISAFPSALSIGVSGSAFQRFSVSAFQRFSVSEFTPAFFPIGINLSGNSGLAFETSSVKFLS